MGYIYKIINDIDDKVYIGKTTRTLKVRFQEHCYEKRGNSKLHNAIQKYGAEHFSIICLEECDNSLLNEREHYWIDFYQAFGENGYNLTEGGDGGTNLSDTQIQQMIILWKDGKSTMEISHIMDLPLSTVYHRVADSCSNFSKEKNRERIAIAQGKKVTQYDIITGGKIAEYDTVASAARAMGLKGSSGIIKACKEKKVSGGYY